MPYVDGFVVAVPKNKIADHKKLARKDSVARAWVDVASSSTLSESPGFPSLGGLFASQDAVRQMLIGKASAIDGNSAFF